MRLRSLMGSPPSTARTPVPSPGTAFVDPLDPADLCVGAVEDRTGILCLEGASVPKLGRLHPISQSLFVDGSGDVGLGTIAPTDELDVDGSAFFRGDAAVPAATGHFSPGLTDGYLGVQQHLVQPGPR